MASLIVAGDTSGTVTLQAPGVSGSTVLNLPTTSGTLLTTAGGATVPFALGSVSTPSITFTGDTNTGIFSPGADTIAFSEGGTESMRIDSAGNVGIGTSSPVTLKSAKTLQVYGNIKIGNDNGAGLLSLGDTASTGANAGVWRGAAGAYGSTGNYLNLGGFDGITFTTGNADIASQTERMRISNAGALGVGKTSGGESQASGSGYWFATGSDGYASQVQTVNTGNYMVYYNRIGTSSGGFLNFLVNNTGVGTITASASSTSYNTSSDYRLKENVAPMTGALATVSALKPVTYKWKVDGSNGQGFIAHELQAVVPDCVTGEKDAVDEEGNPQYQGIDTSFLVATLTCAIQEQQAIIQSQADTITAMETRLTALENK